MTAAECDQREEKKMMRAGGLKVPANGGGGGIMLLGGAVIAAAFGAAFAFRRSRANKRTTSPPPSPSSPPEADQAEEIDEKGIVSDVKIPPHNQDGSSDSKRGAQSPIDLIREEEASVHDPAEGPLINKIDQSPTTENSTIVEETGGSIESIVTQYRGATLVTQESEVVLEEEVETPSTGSQVEETESSVEEEGSDGTGSSSVESRVEAVLPAELIEREAKSSAMKSQGVTTLSADKMMTVGSMAVRREKEADSMKDRSKAFVLLLALLLTLWLLSLAHRDLLRHQHHG